MKKYFCLTFLFFFLLTISCSEDNEKDPENFQVEIINKRIHKPEWLKKVIDNQTITSETGSFFPGQVSAVLIDEKKYVMVENMISSSSCVALQLYEPDGEPIDCVSDIHRKIFSEERNSYITERLWNGMEIE